MVLEVLKTMTKELGDPSGLGGRFGVHHVSTPVAISTHEAALVIDATDLEPDDVSTFLTYVSHAFESVPGRKELFLLSTKSRLCDIADRSEVCGLSGYSRPRDRLSEDWWLIVDEFVRITDSAGRRTDVVLEGGIVVPIPSYGEARSICAQVARSTLVIVGEDDKDFTAVSASVGGRRCHLALGAGRLGSPLAEDRARMLFGLFEAVLRENAKAFDYCFLTLDDRWELLDRLYSRDRAGRHVSDDRVRWRPHELAVDAFPLQLIRGEAASRHDNRASFENLGNDQQLIAFGSPEDWFDVGLKAELVSLGRRVLEDRLV